MEKEPQQPQAAVQTDKGFPISLGLLINGLLRGYAESARASLVFSGEPQRRRPCQLVIQQHRALLFDGCLVDDTRGILPVSTLHRKALSVSGMFLTKMSEEDAGHN